MRAWLRRELFRTALMEPPGAFWRGVLLEWGFRLCPPPPTAVQLATAWLLAGYSALADAFLLLGRAAEAARVALDGLADAWGAGWQDG